MRSLAAPQEPTVDDDGEPLALEGSSNGSNGSNGSGPMPKRGGKFMEGVPGVALFTRQPKLSTIQVFVIIPPSYPSLII